MYPTMFILTKFLVFIAETRKLLRHASRSFLINYAFVLSDLAILSILVAFMAESLFFT